MEDDAGVARLLQKKLERLGYLVDVAADGEEGLALYAATPYDVVAVDQNMPVYNGLEVIRRLADHEPLPAIIMVTGAGDEKTAVDAMKLGARDYIVKDVAGGYLELLPSVIERVLRQQRVLEEKLQAEEALRQYTVELQARNEELDAFAHTVAHDLKEVVGLIIGFAEILQRDYDMIALAEQKHYLDIIGRNGRRMNNIINELLILASVRQLEVELQPLDMATIVWEVQQRLLSIIEEHQAEIITPVVWPIAIGYSAWIEEVWANYLSNAIKYGGRPPRVELGATFLPDGKIRFWVQDNGQGIKPEDQAQLFTPFTQLRQIRARGHGMGLSIVRRIMEKLGGEVGVESKGVPGQGSTFSFTLPSAYNGCQDGD
jgi:signal transduction histidine kinase